MSKTWRSSLSINFCVVFFCDTESRRGDFLLATVLSWAVDLHFGDLGCLGPLMMFCIGIMWVSRFFFIHQRCLKIQLIIKVIINKWRANYNSLLEAFSNVCSNNFLHNLLTSQTMKQYGWIYASNVSILTIQRIICQ